MEHHLEGVHLQGGLRPTAPLLSWAPSAPRSWLLPGSPLSQSPVHVGLPLAYTPSLFFYLSFCFNPPFPQPSIFHIFSLSVSLFLLSLSFLPYPSPSLCLSISLPPIFSVSLCLCLSSLSPSLPMSLSLLSLALALCLCLPLARNRTLSPGGGAREPQPGPFSPPPSSPPSIPRKGNRVPGGHEQGSWAGRHVGEGVGQILGARYSNSACDSATYTALTRCGPIFPGRGHKGLAQLPGKCLRWEQGHSLPRGHQPIEADLGEAGKEELGWGLSSGQGLEGQGPGPRRTEERSRYRQDQSGTCGQGSGRSHWPSRA